MDIPEQFSRVTNGDPGDVLIVGGIMGNSAWTDPGLRWCRSLHLAPDQSIVSVGFPKFMNLDEGADGYKVTQADLVNAAPRGMVATLKIDGSLLIRYVKDGSVRWRTRGSLQVGLDMGELNVFVRNNPILGDPSWWPDASMLFEWVSPKNRIVIGYDRPQLFLIGLVVYQRGAPWWRAEPKMLSVRSLREIAEDLPDVPGVDFYSLKSGSDVDRLLADLGGNRGIEGYVIRFDDEQRLVKCKTEHYFTLHAIRSCLTTARLVDLWEQWGKPSFDLFGTRFKGTYDFECWKWALPATSAMYDGISAADRIMAHLRKWVDDRRTMLRKDFALQAQQAFDGLKLAACFTLLDGKEPRADFWKKMILQNCKQYELRMFKDDDGEDAPEWQRSATW